MSEDDENEEMMICEDRLEWIDLTTHVDRPWRDHGITDAEVLIRGGYFRPLTEREIRDNRTAGVRINNDGEKEGWVPVVISRVYPEFDGVRNSREVKKAEPSMVVQKDATVVAVEKAIQDMSDLRDQFHRIRVFDAEVGDSHHPTKTGPAKHAYNDAPSKFHRLHPVLRNYAMLAQEYNNSDDEKVRVRCMMALTDLSIKIQTMIETKTNKLTALLIKLMMAGIKSRDKAKPSDDPANMSDEALLKQAEELGIKVE